MNTATHKSAILLFAVVVLTAASGSQCHRPNYGPQATYGPRVLTQNPTLGDVVQVVNDNSAKIRSLYTTDATLTVTGAPSLRANMALERQKKLRLRAETAITGPELDLGSNDELFWFWVKRNPPPTLYYCRHDQFANSAAQQMIPIDPTWLVDAIGLTSFDPNLQHSPPVRNANGRLEITTTLPSSTGTKTKKTIVDEARGWVLEQHLFDERGTLIASALTGRHTIDAASGAVVPQEIEIIAPATQFRLKFDVRQWTVNTLAADPTRLFNPDSTGLTVVNLADPNLRFTNPSAQTSSYNPGMPNGAGPAVVQQSTWGMAGPANGVGGNGGVMGPMFTPPGTAASGIPTPTTSPAALAPMPTPIPGLTPLTPAVPASGRY